LGRTAYPQFAIHKAETVGENSLVLHRRFARASSSSSPSFIAPPPYPFLIPALPFPSRSLHPPPPSSSSSSSPWVGSVHSSFDLCSPLQPLFAFQGTSILPLPPARYLGILWTSALRGRLGILTGDKRSEESNEISTSFTAESLFNLEIPRPRATRRAASRRMRGR